MHVPNTLDPRREQKRPSFQFVASSDSTVWKRSQQDLKQQKHVLGLYLRPLVCLCAVFECVQNLSFAKRIKLMLEHIEVVFEIAFLVRQRWQ
jgi:hypothetical protein